MYLVSGWVVCSWRWRIVLVSGHWGRRCQSWIIPWARFGLKRPAIVHCRIVGHRHCWLPAILLTILVRIPSLLKKRHALITHPMRNCRNLMVCTPDVLEDWVHKFLLWYYDPQLHKQSKRANKVSIDSRGVWVSCCILCACATNQFRWLVIFAQ